jgi:cytochrome P450 family 144
MRAPLYSPNPNELFEPATISNPQPLYARLRSETPLSRIAESGVHLVATWDLIDEVLAREPDFSANLTGVLVRTAGDPSIFPMPEFEGGIIATADEPVHSVHRGILQPRFSTRSVAVLEETIRRWTREALREWIGGGAGDFVPVAEFVPAQVVGDLLGLPEGDVTRFRTWAMIGGAILAGSVEAKELAAVAVEASKMIEYLGEHLDRAGADLRHDENAPLLHPLAAAIKEGLISRDAAVGIAATMFSAGGESTAALIGNVVKYLAEEREIARALRQTPELVPRFVEEVGRLDPPFNFHYRVVARSCELGGFELHPGDRLMLLWASANRDAAHVDDPDELRLERKHDKNHMTFGRGGHFCLGAPIARLEGRVVCEELLRATKSIALRPGLEPVYANSIMVRRLERLPLDAEASSR